MQCHAEFQYERHRRVQLAAGFHAESRSNELNPEARRASERSVDLPGAGRFLGNDCAGVFRQRLGADAHLRDLSEFGNARRHRNAHGECGQPDSCLAAQSFRGDRKALRCVAFAWFGGMRSHSLLRQEAPPTLVVEPSGDGRNDSSGRLWRRQQQQHQGSTTELCDHGDGNFGCNRSLDCDFSHGAVDPGDDSLLQPMHPKETRGTDARRRVDC